MRKPSKLKDPYLQINAMVDRDHWMYFRNLAKRRGLKLKHAITAALKLWIEEAKFDKTGLPIVPGDVPGGWTKISPIPAPDAAPPRHRRPSAPENKTHSPSSINQPAKPFGVRSGARPQSSLRTPRK